MDATTPTSNVTVGRSLVSGILPEDDGESIDDESALMVTGDEDLEDTNADDEVLQEEDGASSDDDEGGSFPYDAHFVNPEKLAADAKIKALQQDQTVTERRLIQGWRTTVTCPKTPKDSGVSIPAPASELSRLKLKQRVQEPAERKIGPFDNVQKTLAPLIFNHYDLLFNGRNLQNAESLRQLVCLHAVNHAFM